MSSATLKNAETDLARAREHVEQFKNISQANEEALESLNAAFEQYKLETGKQLVSINASTFSCSGQIKANGGLERAAAYEGTVRPSSAGVDHSPKRAGRAESASRDSTCGI